MASSLQTEPFIVNIGPQHPSTHGVFRIRVAVDGEVITDADMVMGYLHRSMEKLAEERTYTQNIPFTDRLDYLAAMSNNLAYVLAVEKLAGIETPERGQYLRVIMAEFQRIASHCMAVGTFVNDCGAWQTPLMYMFKQREQILDLFEMTCGARITCNYVRIGGVSYDIPEEFLPRAWALVNEMPSVLDEYEDLLANNEILLARSKGVGVLTAEEAINLSCTGPMLRGSGVAWDLRKADPYCGYERFNFDIPVGRNGDCYDRFRVRLEEMRQSVNILRQALEQLPGGPSTNPVELAFRPPVGEAYRGIEGPRGEIGFYVVSDGGPAPYRLHVRAPSLINLSALPKMTIGSTIADAIVILGSVDIVVGEVDR
ncbi:MAG TPA: NADH-quinone oxidoreductase subunit D [Dehalococcoidia bacterium]|nr:NADH-quinone oxidoreductase subunit D [Dehalococcoidia bacterium]